MKAIARFGLMAFMCLVTMMVTAQITTAWTADMPSSKIPSGVTLADIDTLTDPTILRFEIDLTPASTYDNATKSTAFNAIGAALKVYADSNLIEEVWALDPDLDIYGVYVIESINRVWDNFDTPDHIDQYTAATDVFRCRGRFKYIIEY